MSTPSKSTIELLEPQGSYVLKAIKLYKISHAQFYNFEKKWAPKMVDDLLGIPEPILQQALAIYEKAEDIRKTGRLPHPNYFVAVAKRLFDESSRAPNVTTEKTSIQWGKTI